MKILIVDDNKQVRNFIKMVLRNARQTIEYVECSNGQDAVQKYDTEKPDLVIVVGDVNFTIACSLTAVKLAIRVAHVEAGLRSNDSSMPEEINRILTDSISDYLFVTEKSRLENLSYEGVYSEMDFFVGYVMIYSLRYSLPKSEKTGVLARLGLGKQDYIISYSPPAMEC